MSALPSTSSTRSMSELEKGPLMTDAQRATVAQLTSHVNRAWDAIAPDLLEAGPVGDNEIAVECCMDDGAHVFTEHMTPKLQQEYRALIRDLGWDAVVKAVAANVQLV